MLSSLKEIFENPVLFGRFWTMIIVFIAMIIFLYAKREESKAKRKFINLIEEMREKDKEMLLTLKVKPRKLFINLIELGKVIGEAQFKFLKKIEEYDEKKKQGRVKWKIIDLYAFLVKTSLFGYKIVIAEKDKVKILEKEIHCLGNFMPFDNYIADSESLMYYLENRFWLTYTEYLLEKLGEISDNLIEANVFTQDRLKELREMIEYEVTKKLKPYVDLEEKYGGRSKYGGIERP